MALHDSIREYYFSHLGDLPIDTQFHFASRLAAWEQDPQALHILETLRPHFVPGFPADGVLREILQGIITGSPAPDANASKLREPYFKKYPTLHGIGLALFRVRHWQVMYDIDARDALFSAIDEDDLTALEKKLLRDKDAVRILSTYAINFVYLYERLMLGQEDPKAINIKRLYKIGKTYNLKDDEELRLCIYFYTHCIIADSNFYEHEIPDFALPLYKKMLKRLEAIIAKHYDRISLDGKLEFLVCSRLCNFGGKLTGRIEQECQDSVSPEGTFLIDRHNVHAKNATKTSLAASEHRNVLYIMSHVAFRPKG